MAAYDGGHVLAKTGTTGNNTHAGVYVGAAWVTAIIQLVVEAVGATPTVTWKVQGSHDSTDGSNGNWYDLGYVTDSVDSFSVAARTATAVGAQIEFSARPYAWLRLVTSANTNVTYRGELRLDRGI